MKFSCIFTHCSGVQFAGQNSDNIQKMRDVRYDYNRTKQIDFLMGPCLKFGFSNKQKKHWGNFFKTSHKGWGRFEGVSLLRMFLVRSSRNPFISLPYADYKIFHLFICFHIFKLYGFHFMWAVFILITIHMSILSIISRICTLLHPFLVNRVSINQRAIYCYPNS